MELRWTQPFGLCSEKVCYRTPTLDGQRSRSAAAKQWRAPAVKRSTGSRVRFPFHYRTMVAAPHNLVTSSRRAARLSWSTNSLSMNTLFPASFIEHPTCQQAVLSRTMKRSWNSLVVRTSSELPACSESHFFPSRAKSGGTFDVRILMLIPDFAHVE